MNLQGLALLACCTLGACSLQPPYVEPPAGGAGAIAPGDMWWTALHDPAIDSLTLAAIKSNPTLEQAAARIQEARANEGIASSAASPSLVASGSAARAKSASGAGSAMAVANGAIGGLDLSWELDLFGKLRESRKAAHRRTDAREADAAMVRLSLAAQVASAVVTARACFDILHVRANQIPSRSLVVDLIRKKRAEGLAAAVNESRARADLAAAQTAFLSQKDRCDKGLNELVFLSGLPRHAVADQLFAPSAKAAAPQNGGAIAASILRFHPAVIAAEREVAAAYADIGVARAARYPSLDLSAVLTGQWLRAGGSTIHATPWSIGPAIAGTLLDGGEGASNVDLAIARWQLAAGMLNAAIRSAAHDVENALVDQESAGARVSAASMALQAAEETFHATEAQWRAGAVSLFELQDAAHTHAASEETRIAALRDQTLAWVAFVKATANAQLSSKNPT